MLRLLLIARCPTFWSLWLLTYLIYTLRLSRCALEIGLEIGSASGGNAFLDLELGDDGYVIRGKMGVGEPDAILEIVVVDLSQKPLDPQVSRGIPNVVDHLGKSR